MHVGNDFFLEEYFILYSRLSTSDRSHSWPITCCLSRFASFNDFSSIYKKNTKIKYSINRWKYTSGKMVKWKCLMTTTTTFGLFAFNGYNVLELLWNYDSRSPYYYNRVKTIKPSSAIRVHVHSSFRFVDRI